MKHKSLELPFTQFRPLIPRFAFPGPLSLVVPHFSSEGFAVRAYRVPTVLATPGCVFSAETFVYADVRTLIDPRFAQTLFFASITSCAINQCCMGLLRLLYKTDHSIKVRSSLRQHREKS